MLMLGAERPVVSTVDGNRADMLIVPCLGLVIRLRPQANDASGWIIGPTWVPGSFHWAAWTHEETIAFLSDHGSRGTVFAVSSP